MQAQQLPSRAETLSGALRPTGAGVPPPWLAPQPGAAVPVLDALPRHVPAPGRVAAFHAEWAVSDIRWQFHSNMFPSGGCY